MNKRKILWATLALAAACPAASAQSTVNLYGLIDMSIGRTQAPGGTATQGIDSGRMTTSYWGVRGTEDLGGGLKAQFAIESFMRADTGSAGRFNADAFWARNAYVGLESSSLGTLTIGRNTTALFVQTLIFNALGDSFGFSPSIRHYFTSGTVSGDTGWSDSVRYALPRIGGFSATLMAAAGEGNGGRNAGASAQYFAGPLGAGLVWQKVEKGATEPDTTTWQLAGSYDLGGAKLYGQYGKVDNDTTGRSFKILGIGATVPMAQVGMFRAQWGQLKPDIGAKRTTLTLGYTHNLSKRTELYGALMNDKLSGTGSGNNYGVGVRHRF
jgi:predicted porin